MKIGIVGAGIMGQLMALRCLQANWQVSVFDENALFSDKSCSYAAGGMLTPFSELETSEAIIAELGVQSLSLWPTIINDLIEPVYFNQKGCLVIAHTQQRSELTKFLQNVSSKNIFVLQPTILQHNEINELEPELAIQFQQAVFLAGEGCVAPAQILATLTKTLLARGVVFYNNQKITAIAPHSIKSTGESWQFDWVIDCRGLGAKIDIKQLRGVRGEIVWLHAPDVNLQHIIRFLHPRYPVYIIPRPDNIYAIGASQIESEDQSPISVQTILELLSSAYSVHKGFAEARLLKTFTQCRPALPNHLPRIFQQDGLIRINGLYRHGFGIAPALAEMTLQNIQHNKINSSLTTLWEVA